MRHNFDTVAVTLGFFRESSSICLYFSVTTSLLCCQMPQEERQTMLELQR